MKRTILIVITLLSLHSLGQRQNIDVDLLSDIIAKKQEELKVRVLSNIVVKNIRTTNYLTYNSIYNLVDIITTEKNKTVMTQNIMRQIADYSITYFLSDYFIKKELNPAAGGANIIKSFNDNKGFIDLLSYKYKNEQQDQQQIQQKVTHPIKLLNMNPALLANFIMDTLYQSLQLLPFFTSRGFFKKNPERNFFTSGLTINYDEIRNSASYKTIVQPQLDAYIGKISTTLANTSNVFTFIIDNSTQFEDFTKLDNNKIGFLLTLFDETIKSFREEIGQNSFIATIGDIIAKYVIFDMNPNDGEKVYTFKLDVEAIILAFEDKFYSVYITSIRKHKVGINLFFSIGLNYGYFINQNNEFDFDNGKKNLSQIALAGEKLGIKVICWDFKYTHSHEPLEWYQYRGNYRRWLQPTTKPLISNVYAFAYASGLLYNIVDIKSENNFKYAIAGAGVGVEFFNGLEANLSYMLPIIPKSTIGDMSNKAFVNFGFDIPIFEYIKAAREKKK